MSPKKSRTDPDRREQLMAAALDLFSERGYDGTPVSEITGRVGVAQGTFYWHFPTKDHVLVGLIEDSLGSGAAAAAEIFATPVSGREKILRAVEYLQELLSKQRGLWNIVHSRVVESDVVAKAHEEAHEAIVAPFVMLMEEGTKDGSVRLGKPAEIVARLLVQAVDFAFTDEHTRDDPRVLETTKWLVDRALSDGN